MPAPASGGKKKRTLGSRISVEFGTSGSTKSKTKQQKAFVRMLETTAKLFGFQQAQDSSLQRKTKGGRTVTIRGEKATSIKLPTGKKLKSKAGNQYDQLKSIPVPGNATLAQIKTFLRKAKNKPKYFVSPDGRQHSINASGKAK